MDFSLRDQRIGSGCNPQNPSRGDVVRRDTWLPVGMPQSSGERATQLLTCSEREYAHEFNKSDGKMWDQAKYSKETKRNITSRMCVSKPPWKINRFKPVNQPQFGWEISFADFCPNLMDILAENNEVIPENILREAEGLTALAVALCDCTTLRQFLAIVFLYVRDHVKDKAMCVTICEYINTLFVSSELTPQSGEETADWLSTMRSAMTNWKMFRENTAFKQLSKLAGLLVTLGLCEVTLLDFSIGGFKLFEHEIPHKFKDAYDLVDAVLSTVTYFAEGAYLCFKTGSLKPLLIGNSEALELDSSYVTLLQWWDLVRGGNLERVTGKTDQEFDNLLEKTITRYRELMQSMRGVEKKYLTDKVSKLLLIKNDYVTMRISCGVREAPYLIELFGESSQGKTTFGEMLADALLVSQGLPVDREYRAIINPAEAFMSTVTSQTVMFTIDDMSSVRSNFVSQAPTQMLIDLGNNQTFCVPKAEAPDKGKVFFLGKLGVVTTNKKDLDAHAYSNCPYAIQRRLNVVITVVAKEKFQRRSEDGTTCGLDSDKVREAYTVDGNYQPPELDDLWELTIERAVKPPTLTSVAKYEVVSWKGKKLEKVDSKTVIQYCIENFASHRESQLKLMNSQSTRAHTLEVCGIEGCRQLKGCCPYHLEQEPHFGEEIVRAGYNVGEVIKNRFSSEIDIGLKPLETVATALIYKTAKEAMGAWDWIPCLPKALVSHKWFLAIMMIKDAEELAKKGRRRVWNIVILSLFILCVYPIAFPLVVLIAIMVASQTKRAVKEQYVRELLRRNDALPKMVKAQREENSKTLFYGCTAAAGLFVLIKLYRAYRKMLPTQGNLAPTTIEEIAERDSEESPWEIVTKREAPTSVVSRSTTLETMKSQVKKCLTYVSLKVGERKMMTNGLMLKSNVIVIPDHYFTVSDDFEAEVIKHEHEGTGMKFRCRLSKQASILIPGTDLRVCYTPNGGSFPNLLKHFPEEQVSDHPFTMLWREKKGSFLEFKGRAKVGLVTHTMKTFQGADYEYLSDTTFKGLCGAVLISEKKDTFITGFHLGGVEGTTRGCMGTVVRGQLLQAIDSLSKIEGVLLTGSQGVMRKVIMNKTVMTDESLHKKSPLNYMPHGSQIEYFGTCIGGATHTSGVRETPISAIVEEVCGQPNKWGPPKMNPAWFGWQKCLEVVSKPASCFEHALLIKSVVDYKKPLLELIRSSPYWSGMRPLTHEETLCGQNGVRFIDAINKATSIGFPLSGSKSKYVVELDPTDEFPNLFDMTEEVKEEIAYCLSCYSRGERAHTIAKACKKDEVLPKGKDKCRIFYGNSMALTYLVRKYYLPIVRFLQMNPLVAECAVGINCHGPEWSQLHSFMNTHGSDRIFAGDYSKYDQRMPSQLIEASMRILIDLAKECQYSPEDIKIMEAMAGDLVFALIAYNGDLIGLTEGNHISGNSLTVIVNGIGGSLNLRNAYFSFYPDDTDFRKHVSIITYGDDNKGSVSQDRPLFNIKAVSEFLGRYGQQYTMPDKESELTPYMNDEDAEFLKRINVEHPALQTSLGALQEESIFKSLHNHIHTSSSPITVEEACASNVEGALTEWFNHGPQVYEKRRQEMIEVCDRAGLAHLVPSAALTYDDRVDKWLEKYGDTPGDAGA